VARILILEPHDEVRALLAHVAGRLGHEPVLPGADGGGGPDVRVDLVLMEPCDPRALALARTLRARDAELPIVCASIYPAAPQARSLRPVAHLVKPFGLGELERTLAAALAGEPLAA
jgi:CheY-like chemotaxis protein